MAPAAAAAAAAAAPPPDTPRKRPSALRSIIAGSTAGAVEIAITYPFEFAKTHTQLNRRLPAGGKIPWPRFGSQWYAGCTTLIIGNSLKAGIRFVAFDQYKSLLQDADGKISGPRTVIAGFGAGVTESLLAVTPFESIKTTLIDDRKSAQPRMKGFLHAVPIIARERGLRGFFQGFVPTTARQSANSAVRFGSYTSLRQLAQSYAAPGEKLGALSTFGIGGLAGIITVYVTQPLDTVKTRMQSIEARKLYKNSFHCAALIARNEGLLTFWSGALPRLGRLILSGGIGRWLRLRVRGGPGTDALRAPLACHKPHLAEFRDTSHLMPMLGELRCLRLWKLRGGSVVSVGGMGLGKGERAWCLEFKSTNEKVLRCIYDSPMKSDTTVIYRVLSPCITPDPRPSICSSQSAVNAIYLYTLQNSRSTLNHLYITFHYHPVKPSQGD
ncbi:hypothetical protein EYC84_009088 [Monilinia fructicola]|nr:hypothetical protein EYC84_009088 [Monilinia fructicola]